MPDLGAGRNSRLRAGTAGCGHPAADSRRTKKTAAHMRRSSIIGIRKRLSSGSPDSVFRRPGRSRRLQGDLFSLLQACIFADKAFDLSGFATG